MQFVLDNLAAFVVGAVLLGALAVVGLRRQSESVALADHHLSAGHAAALAAVLQGDLESLGAVTAWTDSTLAFSRVVDPAAPISAEVEYRRLRVVADSAGAPPLYRVVRVEGGGERAVADGLAGWSVTLVGPGGQPTTSPGDARAVRVRAVRPSPLGGGGAAGGAAAPPPAVWERTFAPQMLRRTDI